MHSSAKLYFFSSAVRLPLKKKNAINFTNKDFERFLTELENSKPRSLSFRNEAYFVENGSEVIIAKIGIIPVVNYVENPVGIEGVVIGAESVNDKIRFYVKPYSASCFYKSHSSGLSEQNESNVALKTEAVELIAKSLAKITNSEVVITTNDEVKGPESTEEAINDWLKCSTYSILRKGIFPTFENEIDRGDVTVQNYGQTLTHVFFSLKKEPFSLSGYDPEDGIDCFRRFQEETSHLFPYETKIYYPKLN